MFQQPEQLEEIDNIIDMKVSHRKNIDRRRKKFGYESNSMMGLNISAAEKMEAEMDDAPDPDDDEEPPKA